MQPLSPRLTIHCMHELGIKTPSLSNQLSSFEPKHDLLEKAKNLYPDASSERIKSIDDNYFLKCKIKRYRGAIWIESDSESDIWWLVAGGYRTDGSPTDFYTELESKCRNKLKEERQLDSSFKLGKLTHSDWLLPSEDDYTLLAAARQYTQLLIWQKDIISSYREAYRICNHTTTYKLVFELDSVQVDFCSTSENDMYMTFQVSSNYQLLEKAVNIVLNILKIDENSYDELDSTLKQPSKGYLRELYSISGLY